MQYMLMPIEAHFDGGLGATGDAFEEAADKLAESAAAMPTSHPHLPINFGYRTKAEATLAEKAEREAMLSGAKRILFSEGYALYMAATSMKDRARDACEHLWKRIEPELAHLYVEHVAELPFPSKSEQPDGETFAVGLFV